MELFDYAEAIDKNLEIRILARPAPRHSKYLAYFDGKPEIKDGTILSSATGYGLTPDEALANYAAIISNQKLVWSAYGEDREEYETPELVHFTKKIR